jgi:hypothetical protein
MSGTVKPKIPDTPGQNKYLNIRDCYITDEKFNIDTYIADDKWGTLRDLMDDSQSTCLNCDKMSQIDEMLMDSISRIYDRLVSGSGSISEDELAISILTQDKNIVKEQINYNFHV